jgi:arylsulfatase A-like enzyme
MDRRVFIKRFSLTTLGLAVATRTYAKGDPLWGKLFGPDELNAEGRLDVAQPEGEFDPHGPWEQTWRIWFPDRSGSLPGAGFIKVKRTPGSRAGSTRFDIDQSIVYETSWSYQTTARITARNDDSGTPVNWESATRVLKASGRKGPPVLLSTVNLEGAPDGSGHFSSSFTVLDAVQRMSAKQEQSLNFTLLDELDKVKRNHSIQFKEETTIPFGGAKAPVRCYEETGEGTLPWRYYVDRQGRLLLAISGMRAYILDPNCEQSYEELKNFQTAQTPIEQQNVRPVASRKQRPNILFITTDQQAWDTISALGCKHVNTPNLDLLAKRGVAFSKSYTPNPVCSPARACWLTGRTSSENGVISNGMKIVENLDTVGQLLTEAGYETVFGGKLHVGFPDSYEGPIPGFQKLLPEGIGGRGTLGDQGVAHAAEGYLRTRDTANPFFMAVHFLQPHDVCNWLTRNGKTKTVIPFLDQIRSELPPLPDNFKSDFEEPKAMKVSRKEEWDKANWRYYLWSYYRMVEEVDAEIGRVLKALRDTGQWDNTVIVFNADHGEGTAHHQAVLKNTPYEEACRVPFIIAYPKELQQNVLDESHLVSGLDVVATICDFAGAGPPAKNRGLSLQGIAAGKKTPWRDYLVTELNADTGRVLWTSDYKLIAFRDDPKLLFFDMNKDPGETKNLADDPQCQKALNRHIELLETWEAGLEHAAVSLGQFKVART